MGKIFAIDYGKKRTGIATTDEFQIIASGLTTIETTTLFTFLEKLVETEKIDLFIIGEPKQMNGLPSESAAEIEVFCQKFREKFPTVPLEKIDERFTSKIAFQTMIDNGLKKKQRQNKGLIDEIAATILLQDYLQYKR